jgi:hypothetical protein
MSKVHNEQEVVCVKKMRVDKRIKYLIDWLNAVHNIYTLYSCSGHRVEYGTQDGLYVEDSGIPYVCLIVTCCPESPSVHSIVETLKSFPYWECTSMKREPIGYNTPISIHMLDGKLPPRSITKKPFVSYIRSRQDA